jgi:hypothetical protein
MVYFIPNIISIEECKHLCSIFDREKKSISSTDTSFTSFVKNSYGFIPTSDDFNQYLDVLKSKILPLNQNLTDLENVNTYIREYKTDSILKKHIDRKDISITISICLESTIGKEWPLFSEIDGHTHSFNTNVGDAIVLFDADKHIHWRDSLHCNENERVVQFFLHWTPITYNLKKKTTLI